MAVRRGSPRGGFRIRKTACSDESPGCLWRTRYREFGDERLVSRRSVAHNHPNKTPAEVVEKFPFWIRTNRTDRGHEFQALFHWHVADLGMEHVYIKPRTPQLNG